MIEWGYLTLLYASLAAGALCLGLAALRRRPSLVSVGSIAILSALLLAQLIWSIVLVVSGQRAQADTVEYFGYLVTALLVGLAAGIWAVLDRTRAATLVLAIAGFTLAVMVVRMWQLWSGALFT